MIGRLFPHTDDARFLSAAEIAMRISCRFPNAKLDWETANAKLQSELEKLEEMGTPLPIIQGHKNLFGKTTSIEVHSSSNETIGVRFCAYPDSAIEIEGIADQTTLDGAMAVEDLIREIADCLEYDCEIGI